MNPLLQQAEQAVRAKSKARPKDIDRVVEAGERTMFSEGGSKLFKEQVERPGDLVDNAAEGVVKLVGLLFKQSKQTMPPQAAVTGGLMLLFRGLDFLEEAGRVQVTNEVVAQATKAYGSYILQLFGVTPEKLQSMSAEAQQGGQGQPQQPPFAKGLLGRAMLGGA